MITVIIPTKNRKEKLLACLNGIAAQVHLNLVSSVIVVDDHSDEDYEAELEDKTSTAALPLVFLRNKLSGPAHARNLGSTFAQSPILAFLDDDAVPDPNWTATIARVLSHSSISAVTGRILPMDDEGVFSNARQVRYDIRRSKASDLRDVGFLAGGNCAILQEDFIRIGGFNHKYTLMHDRELALRLRSSGRNIAYCDAMVIKHDHHKGVFTAIGRAFRSGYYRSRLEHDYPKLAAPWRRKEFTALMSDLRHQNVSLNTSAWSQFLVIVFLELFHIISYLKSKLFYS